MDLREFTEDFIESVNFSVELENVDFNEEFVKEALEYVMDSGDVQAPESCSVNSKFFEACAYDYDEEKKQFSLFILRRSEKPLLKVPKSTVDSALNKLTSVFERSMKGVLLSGIENPDEQTIELQNLIQSIKTEIQSVKLYLLTDGISEYEPDVFEHASFPDIVFERNIWDMQRLYQQHRLREGKEKIEIDFPTTYGVHVQCLKVGSYNPDVDTYLAFIPGKVLGNIYKKYQQALLEKNVRTFLQYKGVNKDIRKTLIEEPDMFFSYNNGISTTATSVSIEESDGLCFINTISGWQIVNGGQTTASIAGLIDSNDLSKVNVAMKLSVIKDAEKADVIVPCISKSANSQTAIKKSDFTANDPYLVNLENYSRQTWVPRAGLKPIEKWYFERTRGQYLDDSSRLNGYLKKKFKTEYPTKKRVSKTDLAKYLNAWKQRPDLVCNGGEKNYRAFVEDFQKNPVDVTEVYYKETIAKAILFNCIDKIVFARKLGGFKANMNAYLLAAISYKSKGKLDLQWIWEKQCIQPDLEKYIDQLIDTVWDHLTNTNTGSQMSNAGEWSKRKNCWVNLLSKLDALPGVPATVIKEEEVVAQEETLTTAQQAKIEEAMSYSEDLWFSIAKWAKANNKLTPLDRKLAYSYGTYKSRGQKLNFKKAAHALKILDEARNNGFK